jgi:hypothetical protein
MSEANRCLVEALGVDAAPRLAGDLFQIVPELTAELG